MSAAFQLCVIFTVDCFSFMLGASALFCCPSELQTTENYNQVMKT